MRKFTTLSGLVAPLDRQNVDTDQIIPKQFLKRIERTGYEDGLFFDWRFEEDGSINRDFELNAARCRVDSSRAPTKKRTGAKPVL